MPPVSPARRESHRSPRPPSVRTAPRRRVAAGYGATHARASDDREPSRRAPHHSRRRRPRVAHGGRAPRRSRDRHLPAGRLRAARAGRGRLAALVPGRRGASLPGRGGRGGRDLLPDRREAGRPLGGQGVPRGARGGARRERPPLAQGRVPRRAGDHHVRAACLRAPPVREPGAPAHPRPGFARRPARGGRDDLGAGDAARGMRGSGALPRRAHALPYGGGPVLRARIDARRRERARARRGWRGAVAKACGAGARARAARAHSPSVARTSQPCLSSSVTMPVRDRRCRSPDARRRPRARREGPRGTVDPVRDELHVLEVTRPIVARSPRRSALTISASFSARESRFRAASRLSAAERSPARSEYTSTTGRRARVYRAPSPAAWRAIRRATSFVAPVYSEPSRQRST